MIRVLVDMSRATEEEAEMFFFPPCVSPALDTLLSAGPHLGVTLVFEPISRASFYQTDREERKQ